MAAVVSDAGVTAVPHVPSLVRARLLADGAFAALCGGRISTRVPPKLTQPWVQVQVSGGFPVNGDPLLVSPFVQVDGWAPGTTDGDPEVIVWDLAAAAALVLSPSRPVTFRNVSWRGRWTDGPIPDVDTTRGGDIPLYRATVRVELTLRVRPAL